MESRQSKSPPFVIWPLFALLLLGLYPLSSGPMFALYSNGYVSGVTYDRVYLPLHWRLKKTEPSPLVDSYEWYVLKWRAWFGTSPTPR